MVKFDCDSTKSLLCVFIVMEESNQAPRLRSVVGRTHLNVVNTYHCKLLARYYDQDFSPTAIKL